MGTIVQKAPDPSALRNSSSTLNLRQLYRPPHADQARFQRKKPCCSFTQTSYRNSKR